MEFTRIDDTFFMDGTEFDIFEVLCNTNIQYAFEYGERGYTIGKGKFAVLFGDWNKGNSGIEFCKALDINTSNEKTVLDFFDAEFELEWGDEWTSCHRCGKFIRISPDSYSWSPEYVIVNGCEPLCLDCIDYDELLTEYIDNPNKAWYFDTKYLDNAEFVLIDEKWHIGILEISENPQTVYKELKAKHPNHEILFCIDSREQFGVEFVAYKRTVKNDE